jgi:hypothetical protein
MKYDSPGKKNTPNEVASLRGEEGVKSLRAVAQSVI